MLPVAILAGGLATRLRPITEKIPKALVDIAGEPFVVRQLRYLREQGLHRVVLCVAYMAEQIRAVIGDGAPLGLEVRYAFDGPRLLGTGGALKRAVPLLGDAFFVLYGDSFLPIDYKAVEQAYFASGRPALMTVLENADRWDKSNVRYDQGVVREYNKRSPDPQMAYIDYGLSILSAECLDGYAGDHPFDLADVLHDLSIAGRLAGYEVSERFYEIGSHQGLLETEAYFKGVA
jgi:NDP-sugar pyrophosphorylase family protein